MKKLSYEEIKSQRPSLEEHSKDKRFPIFSILDNIRSMYNVGSVFRTSDGARIEKLILCGMTAQPPRKEIDKTALGSVDSVPWEYFKDSVEAVMSLQKAGVQVIAVEHTDRSNDYRKLEVQYPIALVFGHEVSGIRDEVIELADHAVEIPMYGVKQSLNLAVSYGIAVYHFIHRYLDLQKKILI